MIQPSPGIGGNLFYMENILSVYNDQTKEIFQVRVNPVMNIGGLKQKIAAHYGVNQSDVVIIFNGVRYSKEKLY